MIVRNMRIKVSREDRVFNPESRAWLASVCGESEVVQ